MNLSALSDLLLAWVKAQGSGLLQGQKAEPAAQFKPGASYEGRVLAALDSGRHLVQVAGHKLDMGLPPGTRAGDSVRLTYLHAGPRPTFMLTPTPVTPAQQVQLSNTAQQVGTLMRLAPATPATLLPSAAPAPTASAAPAPGPGSVPASVSASAALAAQAAQAVAGPGGQGAEPARALIANVAVLHHHLAALPGLSARQQTGTQAGLLGQAVDGMRAALATGTAVQSAVQTDTAADARAVLPARLAQGLRDSGLFYEAHLARWARGAYSLDILRNEPQARLAAGAQSAAGRAELGGLPEQAAYLAGRQLQMLEGQPLFWQGLLWPGQWMDWLVQERPGEGGAGHPQGEPAAAWNTELSLTLPRLGRVGAQLDLRARDVNLTLWATEPAAAETLRAALPELVHGLHAAGLRAGRLVVNLAAP